jgi:hypothetical protein
MNEQPPEENESDGDRGRGNLVLLVFFVIIVGISVWLVNAMLDARRADECMAQGQRNCNPIEAPQR